MEPHYCTFLEAKVQKYTTEEVNSSQTHIFESSFAFIMPVNEEIQKGDAAPAPPLQQYINRCPHLRVTDDRMMTSRGQVVFI